MRILRKNRENVKWGHENPHASNWTNRTMWTGDNLDILRGMNSESFDLNYLHPPCNSNRKPICCRQRFRQPKK